VGFVRLEQDGPNALLGSLYVEQEYRRTGLAGDLVRAAEAEARQSGATRLFLFSIATAEYFRTLGYQETDVAAAVEALGHTPQVEWYAAHPEALAKETALGKLLV
jgi:N-acetylglutamate synthase-like GNAT family acetyltransferase